jgi:hypothetical protein
MNGFTKTLFIPLPLSDICFRFAAMHATIPNACREIQRATDNKRTSNPSAKMSEQIYTADVIVIGSGFGGAVAADRLVRAGLKVRILERGPWRMTAPVMARGISRTAPLPVQSRPGLILRSICGGKGPKEIRLNRRGLLELHIGKGVKTIASSSVGGGSHLWSWWDAPMIRTIGMDGPKASPKP